MTLPFGSHTLAKAEDFGFPATKEENGLYLFINGEMSPRQLQNMGVALLGCSSLLPMVLRLPPGDQARFVERSDRALSTASAEEIKSVDRFGALCSATGQLPGSAVLSTGLEKLDHDPVLSTWFMSTRRGMHGHRPVFIETFRSYPPQLSGELKKILFRRIPMLMRLSHPNVLPFRGVNTTLFQLSLVYDWVESRNITEYTAAHPDAPRLALLLEVAEALQCLHSVGIAHGDLTAINVLVDEGGRARLARYGLGSIKRSPSLTAAAGPQTVEGLLAPEFTNVTDPPAMESKSADIFAFSMLAIEVIEGVPAFHGQPPAVAALSISRGARPEFPQGANFRELPAQMQDLLRRCWNQNPAKRPTIDVVVSTLRLLQKNEIRAPPHHHAPGIEAEPRGEISRRRKKWLCGLY